MDHNRASQSSGAGIVKSATVILIVLAIISLFTSVGVLVWRFMAGDQTGALLFSLITLCVGLAFTFFIYWLLRGFGEMVQNTAEIADMLEEMRQSSMQDPEA